MSANSFRLLTRLEDWSRNKYVATTAKKSIINTVQAKAVQQAFQAERTFLLMTTKAKKPDPMKPDIIAEIHRYISEVDELKETNRASPLFTHLSMVSEGIVGLGWIMEARPADYVDSALAGSQYNGNKVLKEYKEKYTVLNPVVINYADLPGTKTTSNTYNPTTRSSKLSQPTQKNTIEQA